MRDLTVALLGCGRHAGTVQLPILARMAGVRLAAIADADSAALERARALAPDARLVSDYRAILARVDAPDAVVIALPNRLHAPAAIAFLEANIPVYVEKPLALTAEAGEAVRRAAGGAIHAVGFNYRFNRLYRAARRLIDEGRVGRVERARTEFTVRSEELPDWKGRRDTGGGALLDLGSHHVDMVRFLLGARVERVRADIRSRVSEDDEVDLEMWLGGGCEVHGRFGLHGEPRERFEIEGTLGTLIVDRTRYQDPVLLPAGRARRETPLLRLGQAVRRLPYVMEKRRTPGHEPSHRIALERFLDAVRAGRPFRPDASDGVACLRILEAAERSARSGRPEDIAG